MHSYNISSLDIKQHFIRVSLCVTRALAEGGIQNGHEWGFMIEDASEESG